jgi:hypothetical protein
VQEVSLGDFAGLPGLPSLGGAPNSNSLMQDPNAKANQSV